MSYRLDDDERDALKEASARKQYEYMLRRLVEYGEIWTLGDGASWCDVQTDHGARVFPVWPHPSLAQEQAIEDWGSFAPESLPLVEFENVLRMFSDDGTALAPMYQRDSKLFVISAADVLQDLERVKSE